MKFFQILKINGLLLICFALLFMFSSICYCVSRKQLDEARNLYSYALKKKYRDQMYSCKIECQFRFNVIQGKTFANVNICICNRI